MQLPRPGWAEVDAETMWWREICDVSRALATQVPSGSTVAGLCVSGVGPCLVLCDESLRPLRPAILYGINTRASAEIALLTEELGAAAILEQTGTALSSQAVGPKLEWVRRHEPDVFARATRWYGSNSYIVAKLTGEYVMDDHTASQCDPLYAIHEFDWNADWAQRICGHLQLPYGSTMFLVQIVGSYFSDPAFWTTTGVERETLALAAGTSTAGRPGELVADRDGRGPD